MAKQFDPYQTWLNIPGRTASTSHYELLGLPAFESDPARIQEAYTRASVEVHKWESSKYAETATRILHELTAAYLCLREPRAKREYDRLLRSRTTASDASAAAETLSEGPSLKNLLDEYSPVVGGPSGGHHLTPAATASRRTREQVAPRPPLPIVAASILGGVVLLAAGAVLMVRLGSPSPTAEVAATGGVWTALGDSPSAAPVPDQPPDVRAADGPPALAPRVLADTVASATAADSNEPLDLSDNPFTDAAAAVPPPDLVGPGARPAAAQAAAADDLRLRWHNENDDTTEKLAGPLPVSPPAAEMPSASTAAAENEGIRQAQTLLSSGNFGEARRRLQQAARGEEAEAQATFYLGLLAALVERDFADAKRQFSRSLQAGPSAAVACLNNLAVVSLREDLRQSVRHWRAALKAGSAPEVTENVNQFLSLTKQGRLKISPAITKPLEDQLDQVENLLSVRRSQGWTYMDFVAADGSTPSWQWPGLVDQTCLACNGAGTRECPNKNCRRGVVRVAGEEGIGYVPGTRVPLTKSIQVPLRCPTCNGAGKVPCLVCGGEGTDGGF